MRTTRSGYARRLSMNVQETSQALLSTERIVG